MNLCWQSYDSKFLKIYPGLQPTPLQLEEDLEQLKVLENGYKMKVYQQYLPLLLSVTSNSHDTKTYKNMDASTSAGDKG